MDRIIDIINDTIGQDGIECLPCERINLDYERYSEYRDSSEHKASDLFEHPNPEVRKIILSGIQHDIPSIFKYFLDGSRRTYKIADLKVEGRYLPLVAGQIGVAVLYRNEDKYFEPIKKYCNVEDVIAFPDEIMNDGDRSRISETISSKSNKRINILIYTVKEYRDPVDLAVAKIMASMHDNELRCVHLLSEDGLLQSNSILIKDGPLRYRNIKGREFDITQFRNVIGVSKIFRPSFTIGTGKNKMDVGVLTSSLAIAERTPVFKTVEEDRYIGMWYLRIRPREKMMNPLQGIIKIECYAVNKEEEEIGLDSDRVNTISEFLLRERNVTPYGADIRWATHLYPIYMAETFVKNCMLSDTCFKGYF